MKRWQENLDNDKEHALNTRIRERERERESRAESLEGLRPLITLIANDDNADDERTYATCYE